jgi:transposase
MSDVLLDPLQILELRRLTHAAPGRIALRALMVLWRAEGLSTLEIAQRLGCHRESITPWIERYRRLGVAGLEDAPRSGRPRHLDLETADQVEATLDHSSRETDPSGARWTLARLRAVFRGVARRAFSVETLRRRLHERGFRFRRPRLWAHGEDPAAYEKQVLIELAKEQARRQPQSAPIHFLYGDTSDQHLLAVLRAMWMRVGQQVRVATPPRNGKWSVFGSLNFWTGLFLWQAFPKAVSASFIAFLEYLLTSYPIGQIVLVVDNASYHTSRAVVGWLKEHPRVFLLYLPSHRPQLNPVEKIWEALKEEVSANRSFANLLLLGRCICTFFDNLTPARALQLAGLRNDFCEAT